MPHNNGSAESHTWVAEEGLRNPSHSQLFFTRSLFKALNLSSLIHWWLRVCFLYGLYSKLWIYRVLYVGGWGFAQPLTQPAILYTVFIHRTESVESHTWVTEDLHNPLHSQRCFTRSLFIALNLTSLIRGWVRFSQRFTQSGILYTVFIQSPESVEFHTWVGSVFATFNTGQLFFTRSLFKAQNLSSLIRG